MRIRSLKLLLAVVALALVVPAVASAAQGRVVSATGVKTERGQRLYVDVVVAPAPGQSARQATDEALAQQGARREKPPWAGGPGGPGNYAYTGLVWSPPTVTQRYNPTDQPVAAYPSLEATQSTWTHAGGSSYSMVDGRTQTTTCPSLVRECRGRQYDDGYNDVGWARLSGANTLAVTWWTTSPTEADMALNYRFSWNTGCTDVSGRYDVETVMLHENGHVAGLDHTNNKQSVMYPYYQGARCTLYKYDKDAMKHLYP
jgi:hypothetical protein